MAVIEILNKACILFNCLFLFWFRDKFAGTINHIFEFARPLFPKTIDDDDSVSPTIPITNAFKSISIANGIFHHKVAVLKDHDIMKFFIIVMFIEHLIILFKVYLEEYIEDVPSFVVKKAIKVQH
jgi:hypothetical protein